MRVWRKLGLKYFPIRPSTRFTRTSGLMYCTIPISTVLWICLFLNGILWLYSSMQGCLWYSLFTYMRLLWTHHVLFPKFCFVTLQIIRCVVLDLGIRSLSTNEYTQLASYSSDSKVPHGFLFWATCFFQPTFPSSTWYHYGGKNQIETKKPMAHLPGHPLKCVADIMPPTEANSGQLSPTLEEIDPFENHPAGDKFLPFATSSPRNSSMHVDISGNFDFSNVLEDGGSVKSEKLYDAANDRRFLNGDESSPETLVLHSSENVLSGSFNFPEAAINAHSASTLPSGSTVAQVQVQHIKSSAKTTVLSSSTPMQRISHNSSPLISEQSLSPAHASGSIMQAAAKGEQCDSTLHGTPKNLPESTTANPRIERNIRRLSRGAVLMFSHGIRTRFRSLSGGKTTENCTSKDILAKVAGDQTCTISNVEASGSVGCAVPTDMLNYVEVTITPLVNALIYIKKVREKAVAKTRLFGNAYKKATGS